MRSLSEACLDDETPRRIAAVTALILILRWIHKTSIAHPRLMIVFFVVMGAAGFASIPFIKISPSIASKPGPAFPVSRLLVEQIELFGDQDLLTIAVEFPEPPGDAFAKVASSLSEDLAKVPGVKLVRYRFFDLEDPDQVNDLRKDFLMGMDREQREDLERLLSAQGIKETFRKNLSLLWTYQNKHPILFQRVLRDPVGLDRFMWESKAKEHGHHPGRNEHRQTESDTAARATPKFARHFLGNEHLLFASPDRRVFLIHVTPDFPEVEVGRSAELLKHVRDILSLKLPALVSACPGIKEAAKADVHWSLTGRLAFVDESYGLLVSGIPKILIISVVLCLGFIFAVYRGFWATVILFTPIAAGVGPNYGLMFLAHDEINPLVMSVSGVLFGLGTDYGVHLWSRFGEEIDKGSSPIAAAAVVYEQTGPPVVVGAVTNILAFLCLCLSRDTGIFQLGYIGASGLCITLVATLFLFPAIVALLAGRKKPNYPRMHLRISAFGRVFGKRPGLTAAISAAVLAITLLGALRVSYERDLFKVWYARDMTSTATAERIAGTFGVDFSLPTLLFFDVHDLDKGLAIQRQVDRALRELKQRDHEIVLFDSVSRRMAPEREREANFSVVSRILAQWSEIERTFLKLVAGSILSNASAQTMKRSFESLHDLLRQVESGEASHNEGELKDAEIARYVTPVGDNYRFLTRILLLGNVSNTAQLSSADEKIAKAMTQLPVEVHVCGVRQAMAECVANTITEVLRLGLFAVAAVLVFFFAVFRRPALVALSVTPTLGAFGSVFGVMGILGQGLPGSIVAVAPLIFGLSMDNGVHVVMGSVRGPQPSVLETMKHITRPILFTSVTNVLGFVAILSSRHYSLEFLGYAMLVGMCASVLLSLVTLPAILLIMERKGRGPR
jgi:predicted RND superfamily exporter protein